MTPYGHSLRFTGNGVPWRSITASLVLLLLWDASGWDLPLMDAIGSSTGFPLRDNYWLENVLHWPGPMVRIHWSDTAGNAAGGYSGCWLT
jgi:hypothetical protein